jgi:hypothetical protein
VTAGGHVLMALVHVAAPSSAAVAAELTAAILTESPSTSPVALLHRCRDRLAPACRLSAAVASFSALDARLSWTAAGAVNAVLVRRGAEAARSPETERPLTLGEPFAARGATLPVLRDDVLVLASGPVPPSLRLAGTAAEITQQVRRGLGDAPGTAMVAAGRFLRGAGDRLRRHR